MAGQVAEQVVEPPIGRFCRKRRRGAVGHKHASVDDHGAGTYRFDFFQQVGGDHDGLLGGNLADQFANHMFLVGVQAIGGLVHDQYVGIVQDGLGQADPAAKTLGQVLDRPVNYGFKAGAANRQVCGGVRCLAGKPAHRGR